MTLLKPPEQALWDVVHTALSTMMAVAIFGVYWEAYWREPVIRTVPCSYTIEDMARKINVTLLDECQLVE